MNFRRFGRHPVRALGEWIPGRRGTVWETRRLGLNFRTVAAV